MWRYHEYRNIVTLFYVAEIKLTEYICYYKKLMIQFSGDINR